MYSGISHDQVLSLVCWLVSSSARLQVEFAAGIPVRYILQTFDGSKWLNSKEIKKASFGFWKEKTIRLLSNEYV